MRTLPRSQILLSLLLGIALVACPTRNGPDLNADGEGEGEEGEGEGEGDGEGEGEAGEGEGEEGEGEGEGEEGEGAEGEGEGEGEGEPMGRLEGRVTRSAQPNGDARGDVYIAVFSGDPVVDDDAQLIANLLLPDADLSDPGSSVSYSLAGIPPRPEPYSVTAFLDDDGNVDATDPASAAPDQGDLVTLRAFHSPEVSVAAPGTVTFNLDLNLVKPF